MSAESIVAVVQSRPPGVDSSSFDQFYVEFLNQLGISDPPSLDAVHRVSLKTKYYAADVQLHRLVSPTIGTETFADAVEAVVIHFDSKSDPDLQTVDQWISFIQHWEPSVRILTCDRVTEEKKISTADWCTRRGYELVELQPDDESLEEAKEYGEEIGFTRMLQVLKAHSWSNLEFCDEKDVGRADRLRQYLSPDEETPDDDEEFGDFQSAADQRVTANTAEQQESFVPSVLTGKPAACGFADNFSDHKNVQHCADYAKLMATSDRPKGSENPQTSTSKPAVVDSVTSIDTLSMLPAMSSVDGDISDEKSFEDLFKMFGEMKTKADQLPLGERKEFAERMVTAYWSAIGGDVGELEGIGDSDDEEES